MTSSGGALAHAEELVGERLGLAMGASRRAALERCLDSLSAARRLDAGGCVERLRELPDGAREWRQVAAELTVGETYFFRDRACFEALEREVLPELIATRRARGMLSLRLWSAGCSTGEEPYSLAILIDRLLVDRARWQVTILGTDVSCEALVVARAGLYREWSLRDVPGWIRDRWFERDGDRFRLDAEVRRMVTFASLNLARAGYPSIATNTVAMNLVLCRNVLMYFTPRAQRAALGRLHGALAPGGRLVLAPVEAPLEGIDRVAPRTRAGEQARPPPRAASSPADAPASAPRPAVDPHDSLRAERPVDAATLVQRSREAADAGLLEKAAGLCRAALELDGASLEARLLLAAICREREEISLALRELRTVIYLVPDCAAAHFQLGALLVAEGEPGRGRRSLHAALELLEAVPPGDVLPYGGGERAGELAAAARACLEAR